MVRVPIPALLAIALPVLPLGAQKRPAEPESSPLVWNDDVRRHVAATLVVRGVIRVDAKAVEAAQRQGGHAPAAIEVQEMVHGPDQRMVTFRVHVPEAAKPRPDQHPTPDELVGLDGRDRVLFLVTVRGENYLTDSGGQAIVEPQRDLLARLKQREEMHRRLLREPLVLDPGRKQQVARIFSKVARDADQQREAFAAMERLGVAALAEIVAAMDDRRQLPVRELTLANKAADAFEARRIYHVERVVDGTAAVLNQITGEWFGSLDMGVPDEERDACVRAWTIYAHYVNDAARRESAKGKR